MGKVIPINGLWIEVKVECYSGYKADESPRRVFIRERPLEVTRIVDRWYDLHGNYYKVELESRGIYLLKQELKRDKWFARPLWLSP